MTLASPTQLLGAWSFERTIDDRREGRLLHVSGSARFVERNEGVDWREEGTLEGPSGPLPVEQTRRIEQTTDGRWLVLFSDGREFHPWDVGVELIHECSPDSYRGFVEALPGDPGGWSLRWAAEGPAKSYTIETRYTRLDA